MSVPGEVPWLHVYEQVVWYSYISKVGGRLRRVRVVSPSLGLSVGPSIRAPHPLFQPHYPRHADEVSVQSETGPNCRRSIQAPSSATYYLARQSSPLQTRPQAAWFVTPEQDLLLLASIDARSG